ncbi:MAG: hypothetical protein D6772_07595 [Bacteroidetes bacterium]|nr:MAG: hypothetical protein D6772_07595 [Bacteroidota bacterium]
MEYQRICQAALKEEPPPIKHKRGRSKNSKGRNLANRLLKYQTEVLRFALEENIPFSNNQAERDLRPIKGKQKVAGCFRTWRGLIAMPAWLAYAHPGESRDTMFFLK